MTALPHAHSIVVVPGRARPTPVVTVARLVPPPDRTELPAGTVDLGGGARLHLGDFCTSARTWGARARLSTPGLHAARFARVDVDLSPWSDGTWELSVRPVSRQLSAWGRRRRNRYFTLAHLAADQLARLLVDPCDPRGDRHDLDHPAGLDRRPTGDGMGRAA
jgi:hypothetical protein